MATLPKHLNLVQITNLSGLGAGNNPMANQNVDLANTHVVMVTVDTATTPNRNIYTNIRLSDLVNYIVDTAKGQ